MDAMGAPYLRHSANATWAGTQAPRFTESHPVRTINHYLAPPLEPLVRQQRVEDLALLAVVARCVGNKTKAFVAARLVAQREDADADGDAAERALLERHRDDVDVLVRDEEHALRGTQEAHGVVGLGALVDQAQIPQE